MQISGVGIVQVFPTKASNGLGSASPPQSLTLPTTSLAALGFPHFSQTNPTVSFIVADGGAGYGDNSGEFELSQAPAVGLWWNPAESGTGYALDYKHGVLVVTVYSYTAAGAPIWYLASGPVTNNVFTSTLDKYQGGQCISCAYQPTAINGNDGTVSITFTSPTTARMVLPGGRSFQIVPQAF